MAGKVYGPTVGGTLTGRKMGWRDTRAYAEGRQAHYAGAAQGTNPHVAGSSAYVAWDNGWSLRDSSPSTTKYETGVPG